MHLVVHDCEVHVRVSLRLVVVVVVVVALHVDGSRAPSCVDVEPRCANAGPGVWRRHQSGLMHTHARITHTHATPCQFPAPTGKHNQSARSLFHSPTAASPVNRRLWLLLSFMVALLLSSPFFLPLSTDDIVRG